jgi:electron transfer flavoprotein beta subunit
MNILVLIAGIADPKWPLPTPLNAAALAAERARHPLLSPFDEAALELALKLRDADPATRIHALVSGASADDPLLRHVAGYRLDQVEGVEAGAWPAWHSGALAAALAARLRRLSPAPDLLLIGREFGDLDDGSLPAALSATLGWPFVPQVLGLEAQNGGVQVLRQHAAVQEHLRQPLPALLAVTNHARNRLRHPLLKNVMAAKRLRLDSAALPDPGAPLVEVQLGEVRVAIAPPRAGRCQMLDGDALAQAQALAALLLTEGAV